MSSGIDPERLIHDWNRAEGAPPVPSGAVALLDDTLRDGLQNAAARRPTPDERAQMLRDMAAIGVECVNAGLPGSSPNAFEDARLVCAVIEREKLRLRVAAAGRTLEADMRAIVELSQRTGVAVEAHAFVGSSEIRWVAEDWDFERVRKLTETALAVLRRAGLAATFVTEDTTRSRPNVLRELFRVALDAGVTRLCLCDTVGHATPEGTRRLVAFARALVDAHSPRVAIDWHGHNDRGLALANALAALDAGADRAHATALGIGERSGNVPMELLVVNLALAGRVVVDSKNVVAYAERCAAALGCPIPANYPLFGANAFRTATGVHAAAIAKAKRKNPSLAGRVYSSVPAEAFGRDDEICVGAMSGASNVVYWLERHGFRPTESLVAEILERAKRSERVLTESEILDIANRA